LLTKIDHVAIAVRSLESALEVYEHALGLSNCRIEEVPEQKIRLATLVVGETRIELLEATAADSPVAGFIAKRGEGLHHICFQVENLDEELQKLTAAGLHVIDQTARIGAGGCRIAFLHPSGTAGVLIELSQHGEITHTHSISE
jgi:methylmalonyl-CoA/ethylmalonyl-CoA epimerase